MEILRWHFAFHGAISFRDAIAGKDSWRCIFGHVSAYGYTADETWFFYDPKGCGADIKITHLHDEVIDMLASIRCTSDLILALDPDERSFRVPLFPPQNCVTQCAALIRRRAFTPWGFRKMLLRENAEVIWEREGEIAKGRSSR